MVTIGPMVPLTTTANGFAARVLAAHLGAEGIVWELRGGLDGPYPVGPVEVLVAEDDLVLARQVVAEHPLLEVADGGGHAVPGAEAAAGRAPRELWVVLGAVLGAAAVLLGRLLMVVVQAG